MVPDMDRAMLLDHLAMAERHIADGEKILADRRSRIERVRAIGHDTAEAEKALADFEEAQTVYIADRERLLGEFETARLPDRT